MKAKLLMVMFLLTGLAGSVKGQEEETVVDGVRYRAWDSSSAYVAGYEGSRITHANIVESVTVGSVTYPVTFIGGGAFACCYGLQTATIPSSITEIGGGAFQECPDLHTVTLATGVIEIGSQAFGMCTGLQEITLPSSLILIGDRAFEGCSGFTSITIPSGVIKIEEGAFWHCTGLKTVTLPSSVTLMENRVFQYCDDITDIYCKAEVPPVISEETFIWSDKVTLHVPTGCKAAYQGAPHWNQCVNIVEGNEASIDGTDAGPAVIYADGVLRLKGSSPAAVSVYTAEGKCVMTRNMSAGDGSCDLTALPEGTYVIRVKAGGKAKVLKIVR